MQQNIPYEEKAWLRMATKIINMEITAPTIMMGSAQYSSSTSGALVVGAGVGDGC